MYTHLSTKANLYAAGIEHVARLPHKDYIISCYSKHYAPRLGYKTPKKNLRAP